MSEEPTYIYGPEVTIARANAGGWMQCVECEQTFGPRRYTPEDQWGAAEITEWLEVAKGHYFSDHAEVAAKTTVPGEAKSGSH